MGLGGQGDWKQLLECNPYSFFFRIYQTFYGEEVYNIVSPTTTRIVRAEAHEEEEAKLG
jgi:hypothetical protein